MVRCRTRAPHPSCLHRGSPDRLRAFDARVVPLVVRGADGRPGAGLAGHRRGRAHAHLRAHRAAARRSPRSSGASTGCMVGAAAGRPPASASASSTSRRSRRSSTTSTATCARRSRASRWPRSASASASRGPRRDAHGRHAGRGAARVRHASRRTSSSRRPSRSTCILTSQAREALRAVRWVIVDEIHALAGTKRGAHLALSLERLEALARRSRRSASACRPPSGRCRRSPRTWAGVSRRPTATAPARHGP